MNFEEASTLLNSCIRWELRDHAFGDAEVDWIKSGEEIASGYFSGRKAEIFIASDHSTFTGDDAYRLRNCGAKTITYRNDETGPDEYQEGVIMPTLTMDDVLEKIAKDMFGK